MIVIDATPLQNDHRHRGIGYYVRGLVSALVESDLTGWVPLLDPRRPVPDVLAARGGPRIWQPRLLEYHGGWLLNELRLPMLARAQRWTAFHATDPRTVPEPRLTRTVSTIYDLTPLEDAETWRGLTIDQRIAYRRALSNARRSAVVVTISEAVRSEVVQRLRIPESRVRVVYPGIDLDSWQALPASGGRAGLLFVGAPAQHKNLDTLLRALAMIPTSRRPVLTIVGPWSPDQIRSVEAQASAVGSGLPAVEPYATPARLQALYGRAAALAMPSRREGFGLPVLEAMASGCPVIASDIPVHGEIAGGVAILVPADDDRRLAAAIDGLLADPDAQRNRSLAGRARAAAFNWPASLAALLDCYRAVGLPVEPTASGS